MNLELYRAKVIILFTFSYAKFGEIYRLLYALPLGIINFLFLLKYFVVNHLVTKISLDLIWYEFLMLLLQE